MRTGRPAALVTVVGFDGSAPRHAGARMVVYADEELVGTVGGGEWERRCILAALDVIADGVPKRLAAHLTRDLGMCCGGAMDAYIEPLAAQQRLHVFGAGHVGKALVEVVSALGFRVHVYDERDDWLDAERFPGVTRHLGDPRRALPSLGPVDHAVVLTHSHSLDQDLVEALLPQPFAYLGMIGSRAKVAKFLVRFRAAGLDEALFQRLSAPIGLDIGAETPEEIAVSIAAELVRVRRQQGGPTVALSEHPLAARGGDGTARPPALDR
ncbi:MAG: xanthine dehydrogenase accessory protein XdhC [Proteobacteria bacterium]|nr:xanthine dehydrogenase accessory protein XdhC [Pseudomonadota bacterium]MCP4916988.1 xanthine dehydrogenase accessory protein XdhC [Pseudomonadota bacterium]